MAHDLTPEQIIGIATDTAPTSREALIKSYVEYHESQQFIVLSDRQEKYLPAFMTGAAKSFSNICKIVVLVLTDRINIERFVAVDDKEAEYAVWVNDIFEANGMPEKQSELHKYIFRDGRGAVFVENDPEDGIVMRPLPLFNGDNRNNHGEYQPNARFHRHGREDLPPKYVGYRWMYREYDLSGTVSTRKLRLNFYALDNEGGNVILYRFLGESESDLRLMTEDELLKELHNPTPQPETLKIRHLPIIEFSNEGKESELFEVKFIQDIVNHSVGNNDVVSDSHAFPLLAADSWEGPTDDDGNPLPVDINEQSLVVGQGIRRIDAADMEKMWSGGYDRWVRIVASVKQWPLWIVDPTNNVGAVPSGESLRIALSPLIQQISARQLNFGPSWRNVFNLARELAGNDTPGEIKIEWLTHNTLSLEETKKQRIENANNMGLSQETQWRTIENYDDEAVETEKARKTSQAPQDFDEMVEANSGGDEDEKPIGDGEQEAPTVAGETAEA